MAVTICWPLVVILVFFIIYIIIKDIKLDNFPLSSDTTATIGLKPSFGADVCVSNAVTLNTRCGQITTESLTTAAGASQDITLTNSTIVSGDIIMISKQGGSNTRRAFDYDVTATGTGTATITIYNTEPINALNGTLIFNFHVIKQ